MDTRKPNLVGINHVALEVGDVDRALAFYGQIFTFSLRGRNPHQAFIDIGDQFIALMQTDGAACRPAAAFRNCGGRPFVGARAGRGGRREAG